MLPSIPKLADYEAGVRRATAAAGGGGPIAFGASLGTPVKAAGTEALTIAMSSVTVPSGARVIVNVSWYNPAITASMGASGGLTWTQEKTQNGTSDTNRHIAQFSAHAPSGLSSATLTATFSGNAFGRSIQGFYATGINTGTSAADVSASARVAGDGSGTLAWSSGATTTTVANTLISGFAWYDGVGTTTSTPVTDTEITDTNDGSSGTWVQQYRIVSATGSNASAGTMAADGFNEVLAIMVAYKMS